MKIIRSFAGKKEFLHFITIVFSHYWLIFITFLFGIKAGWRRLETERCCTDSVRICEGTLGFFSLKRPHIWKLVVLGCGAICHWDSQQFSCGERIKYAAALSQYKQTKLFILDLMHCFIVMCDSLPFLVTVTSFGSSSAFTVTKYNWSYQKTRQHHIASLTKSMLVWGFIVCCREKEQVLSAFLHPHGPVTFFSKSCQNLPWIYIYSIHILHIYLY